MSIEFSTIEQSGETFQEAYSLAFLRAGSAAWLAMTHSERRRAVFVELAYLDRVVLNSRDATKSHGS